MLLLETFVRAFYLHYRADFFKGGVINLGLHAVFFLLFQFAAFQTRNGTCLTIYCKSSIIHTGVARCLFCVGRVRYLVWTSEFNVLLRNSLTLPPEDQDRTFVHYFVSFLFFYRVVFFEFLHFLLKGNFLGGPKTFSEFSLSSLRQ